jgi:hypothetical protein
VLDAFPPESYRRLSSLMKRGKGYRAPGPCAIPECSWVGRLGCDAAKRDYGSGLPLFVWDHCHPHDYVRGMLCRYHNGQMRFLDGQDHYAMRGRWSGGGLFPLLCAHWERCPPCAERGPWRPLMVFQTSSQVARSRRLYVRSMS